MDQTLPRVLSEPAPPGTLASPPAQATLPAMSEPQRDPPSDPNLPNRPENADLPGSASTFAPPPLPTVQGPPPLPTLPQPHLADPPGWTAPQAERLPWEDPPPPPAAKPEAAPIRADVAPTAPEPDDFAVPRRRTSAVLPALPVLPAEPLWREKLRGYAALAGLLLLMAAIAIPWLQRRRTERTVPEAGTLLKAAELLGKRAQPGDAVGFAPGWSSHQRILFQQRWLDKGWDPKADFLTAHPLDLWQADGKQRLWVVTTHGWAERLDLAAKAPGVRRLEEHQLGHGTAVELYSLPSSTTVFDVRKDLARTAVQSGGPENWQACTWQAATKRFGCGGAPWLDVYQELQEVGNTRRDCVYLHPPHDRGAVRVTASEATAVRAVGWFGNRLWAVRHGPEGAPVRFRVLVGGQVKFEKTLATDDFGWYPFDVALPPDLRGQPVTLEAYSDKEAWREFCVDARLQTAPVATPPKVTP